MSSVICIQTYDRVWVGADSAVSAQIDGEVYRLHEDGKKLFHVSDMVIFCSGIMELAGAIMQEFETSEDYTLETLQKIARHQCADYSAEHPEVERRGGLFADMLIATYDKERAKTVVYSISPYHNDFEIVERTLNSSMDFAIWAGGIRTQQATDAAMKKFRQTLNVNFALKYAFHAISYEGIGGDLTVYEIGAGGVRKSLQHKIREKPGIKRLTRAILDRVVAELIIAESVVGQLGDFVTMKIGAGNNVTQINTSGIAAGHATFGSAPFRVDMEGNVIANKLTANSAQINTSNLNASTWKDGYFTGNITANGTITGAHLVGGSIRSNTDIDITRDIRVGSNIYLGLTGSPTNDRRIEFVDGGPYRSYIGFNHSTKQLDLYAANDIRINSGLNLSLSAAYDVNVNANRVIIPFNTYLGSASSSNRLLMQADLGDKADVTDAGYNLSFDPITRNLKMYNRYGDLMAQVTIPK